MIQAVLFDLDGTLLPHDIDDFLPRYFGLLDRWIAETLPGVDLLGPLVAASEVMMANDGSRTNEEAFWSDFSPRVAHSRAELEPILDRFYRERFPALGAQTAPDPVAAATVAACRQLGLRCVLATNAVFPRVAIEERMRWAGLDPAQFDRVTSFETMTYCKPHPGYFSQIAAGLALAPAACLMVGNEVEMDLRPAAAAGLRTCLVTNDYQVLSAAEFAPDVTAPLAGLPALLREQHRP